MRVNNSKSRGFWVQFLSTNDVEMYKSFIPEDVFKSSSSRLQVISWSLSQTALKS